MQHERYEVHRDEDVGILDIILPTQTVILKFHNLIDVILSGCNTSFQGPILIP